MPLSLAARWIATSGGAVELDPRVPSDLSKWQDAFAELLLRIASEEVTIIGIRDGEREKLSGLIFAGIRVVVIHFEIDCEYWTGDELFLFAHVYRDEESWQADWNDRLESMDGVKWSKLMVLRSDVARCWPFGIKRSDSSEIFRTGAPGRPTSMHLVRAEFDRRWEHGESASTISAEAESLADWLRSTHPYVPQLKSKTIANRLRAAHRARIAKAPK